MFLLSMKKNVQIEDRGVTGYQILGGQSVMWRAAAGRRLLLFCQKLGGQLPTLPTRQLRPCKVYPSHSGCVSVSARVL